MPWSQSQLHDSCHLEREDREPLAAGTQKRLWRINRNRNCFEASLNDQLQPPCVMEGLRGGQKGRWATVPSMTLGILSGTHGIRPLGSGFLGSYQRGIFKAMGQPLEDIAFLVTPLFRRPGHHSALYPPGPHRREMPLGTPQGTATRTRTECRGR